MASNLNVFIYLYIWYAEIGDSSSWACLREERSARDSSKRNNRGNQKAMLLQNWTSSSFACSLKWCSCSDTFILQLDIELLSIKQSPFGYVEINCLKPIDKTCLKSNLFGFTLAGHQWRSLKAKILMRSKSWIHSYASFNLWLCTLHCIRRICLMIPTSPDS